MNDRLIPPSGISRNLFPFLFSLFLTLITCSLNAQVKSGFRIGINLTSMSIKMNDVIIKAETPVGIHWGGMYEVPFSNRFTIQSGLLLSSKGTDYNIDSIYHSIAPTYAELPLHAVYYFGKKPTRMSVFAGPYFSSAFGGYKIESAGLEYLKFGPSMRKDLKFLDTGFDFGSSVNIKNFIITFQYSTGLRNVSPKEGVIMKNRVFGISIGNLSTRKR